MIYDPCPCFLSMIFFKLLVLDTSIGLDRVLEKHYFDIPSIDGSEVRWME